MRQHVLLKVLTFPLWVPFSLLGALVEYGQAARVRRRETTVPGATRESDASDSLPFRSNTR